jgi:glycosyltransferase involved in cell wall biosynthesis
MDYPIVSIILPTFNRAELLKKCIESIYMQTYKKWELIVIDDGSTDNTDDFMNKLLEKDSRIRFLKIERSNIPGISPYLNLGIKSSVGKYIARIDDDDTWCFEDKLKQQVEFLESHPDYVLVGGGVHMVDNKHNILYKYYKKEKDDEIRKSALCACPFEHTTIMFRKDAAVSSGGYHNYKVAEDWDFFLRLGTSGKFYNFQEYYTNYFQAEHSASLSNQKNYQTEIAKTELNIIKLYRNDYPGYYKGFVIHYLQFLYSFFPVFIKKRFQFVLRFLKRKFF